MLICTFLTGNPAMLNAWSIIGSTEAGQVIVWWWWICHPIFICLVGSTRCCRCALLWLDVVTDAAQCLPVSADRFVQWAIGSGPHSNADLRPLPILGLCLDPFLCGTAWPSAVPGPRLD